MAFFVDSIGYRFLPEALKIRCQLESVSDLGRAMTWSVQRANDFFRDSHKTLDLAVKNREWTNAGHRPDKVNKSASGVNRFRRLAKL